MGVASITHSADEYNQELPSMESMHESTPPPVLVEEENVYTQPSSLPEPESSFMLEEEVTPSVYEPVEEKSVYNQEQGEEEVGLSLFEEQ